MSKINNPFLIYAYAGPDYFCDRAEETEQLISALRNGRNVTLMSPLLPYIGCELERKSWTKLFFE